MYGSRCNKFQHQVPLVVDQLSVWTIGFKWSDHDAGRVWLRVPPAVRDIFSTLLEAILKDHLACLTLDQMKWDGKDLDEAPFYIRHWLDDINAAIRGERYSRKLLRHALIERFEFQDWCERCSIPLPEFWFPAGWKEYRWPIEGDEDDGGGIDSKHLLEAPGVAVLTGSAVQQPEAKVAVSEVAAREPQPRPNQKARWACEAIATEIWKDEPEKTIADMCRDDRILKLGGARWYDAETVRRWIQKAAPAEVSAKRGRPRKKNPSEE